MTVEQRRPRYQEHGIKGKVTSLRMPEAVLLQTRAYARRHHMTLGSVIVEAVKLYLMLKDTEREEMSA